MKLFDGRAIPLFPLPSLVLYPQIVQPLYVFEPRYRELFRDVIDSHGKIAMALLAPGYEPEYHGSPEIRPVVTVGSVLTYRTREDGTSDLVLLGERRARIVEEIGGKIYRRATLLELKDRPLTPGVDRSDLRSKLKRWWRALEKKLDVPGKEDLQRLQKTMAGDENLSFLVDFLAFHFLTEVGDRQALLEELDVDRRARTLLERLSR